MNSRVACLVGVLVLLCVQVAHAQRFAVVIGNNVGRAHEQPLQFAERDASRVADLLTSVGSMQPDHVILAQGTTAHTARRSLIAINERIRTQTSSAEMLLVYYSGHGDAESLHLGTSNLAMAELEGLVRGSAARLRILIIDSCRSGALTRAKGGRPAEPIRIEAAAPTGDGVIILTASAAGEDAHESERLGGSFFTHHLLSGLLGAADADRDDRVTVTEAYDYAYANTLRDSSATIEGPQHPSYRYDLSGQGDVALTTVKNAAQRGRLAVPGGLSILIMRERPDGPVLAEARQAPGASGVLSLPPGRIFVRARTEHALFEQALTLRAGQVVTLHLESMDRIELTRLARKGGSHIPMVMGLGISAISHRGVSDGSAYCSGASLHGIVVLRALSMAPRLSVCRETFEVETLESSMLEAQAAFSLSMHRDLSRAWSAFLGPELSLSYFRQSILTPAGTTTTRDVFGGAITVQGGVELAIGAHAITARALAQTYILELQNPGTLSPEVSAVFAWGAALGVTRYLR